MKIPLTLNDILAWLREDNPERLKTLWGWADETRRLNVGDTIHLRGLVEISSHCSRQCGYCGLRVSNNSLSRYRMAPAEIMASARQAVAFGYGTVVLQAGEDFGLTCQWVTDVVRQIKRETPLAVLVDLPGPKLRLGDLPRPLAVKAGEAAKESTLAALRRLTVR